jgi:hypothetical protein
MPALLKLEANATNARCRDEARRYETFASRQDADGTKPKSKCDQ